MNFIAHLTSLLSLLPILLAIGCYKDLRMLDSRVFFFFLVGTCLIDLLGLGLSLFSINNHFCYNIIIIWIGLFNVLLSKILRLKLLTTFSFIVTFSCFWGIVLQLGTFNKFIFMLILLNLGINSVLSLFDLTHLKISLLKSWRFWAYSSLSFFAFSTFSMFLFIDYIVENKNTMILNYYIFYNFFVTLTVNIFYSISFLCLKKEKISL